MIDLGRRRLDELFTRYQFHPEVRDLFVEGPRDLGFFRWFFSHSGHSKVRVYEIESVDVPANVLETHGFGHGGNRGRLIALAATAEASLAPSCEALRCLIDRDFHDFGEALPELRYLILTDDACLECLALTESNLSKLFSVYLGKNLTRELFDSILDVLQQIFSARWAKLRENRSAPWFDGFTRHCTLSRGRVTLDFGTYLERVVQVSGEAVDMPKLKRRLSRFPQPADRRRVAAINGHDAVDLLGWLAQRMNVDRQFTQSTVVQRALLTSVEFEDVKASELGEDLITWAG